MINKENRDSAFISYEQKQLYKKLFIRAGILSGFFCVLFGLLVVFSVMASKSWRTSVRSYLTSYLNADEKQSYELGDSIHISSSISSMVLWLPYIFAGETTWYSMDFLEWKNLFPEKFHIPLSIRRLSSGETR